MKLILRSGSGECPHTSCGNVVTGQDLCLSTFKSGKLSTSRPEGQPRPEVSWQSARSFLCNITDPGILFSTYSIWPRASEAQMFGMTSRCAILILDILPVPTTGVVITQKSFHRSYSGGIFAVKKA